MTRQSPVYESCVSLARRTETPNQNGCCLSVLHRSLRVGLHPGTNAGITGVKVDCQAGVGLIGSALGGGPAVAQQYHLALEESIKQHFPSNDCINCMCHSTENFYRQVYCRATTPMHPAIPSVHMNCHLCLVCEWYRHLGLTEVVAVQWTVMHHCD